MIVSWRDQMEGGDDAVQSDDRLDSRLRDLDGRLTTVFTADLDDRDLRAVFLESVARRVNGEREAAVKKRPHRGRNAMHSVLMWAPLHRGQISRKAWLTCLACALLVLGLLVALHGFPSRRGMDTNPTNEVLEKPDLKFSIMTTTDLIPFWLAVDNNYFTEAGFRFDTWRDVIRAANGSESVSKLVDNQVDIAYGTYIPFVTAQYGGTADLKLVAEASSAGPGSCMVVAGPSSRVKTIRDMAGARVAVTARNTMSELLTMSALKSAGVDWTQIQWIQVPFKDMAGKLAVGEVDAAFMTEPFLSQAKTIGAVPVFDTAPANSHTADMPTAGFGASAEFVRKNPKTVAAFQRVMARATAEARTDRSKVDLLLQKSAEVDAQTAKSATLLTFQSSLDVRAIQRVADLMLEFGLVSQRIDASRMIANGP